MPTDDHCGENAAFAYSVATGKDVVLSIQVRLACRHLLALNLAQGALVLALWV